MKHNGKYIIWGGRKVPLKLTRKIGLRSANPNIDQDLRGQPLDVTRIVFVRIADCRIYQKDGKSYYDAKGVKSIRLSYSDTHKGYSEWTKRTSALGTWVYDNENRTWIIAHEYYQCTVYYCENQKVYLASLRAKRIPAEVSRERAIHYALSEIPIENS